MGIPIEKIKTRMRELVCEKFITINSKGKIKFKSNLNYAIEQGKVSYDDALSISLELMYGIKNYGFNGTNIIKELEDLILKVNEYNISGSPYLKHNVLFFKNYDFEQELLLEYVDELRLNHKTNLKNNISQKIVSTNNKNIINIHYQKSKSYKKIIKKHLNKYSSEELCFILDLDPNVNISNNKTLKNEIATKLSEISSFNLDKLENYSPKDVKILLNANDNLKSGSTGKISNLENKKFKNEKEFPIKNEKSKKLKNFSGKKQINREKNEIKSIEDIEKIKKEQKERERIKNQKIRKLVEEERKQRQIEENRRRNERIKKEMEQFKIVRENLRRKKEIEQRKFEEFLKTFLDDNECNIEDNRKREKQVINDEKNNFLDNLKFNETTHYISNSDKKELKNNYNTFLKLISNNDKNKFDKNELMNNFDNIIDKVNNNFIENGVENYRKFFEKIYDGKSLDDDQIKAVLIDNDATQIIAGAGTGKTLTLQGKVKYLIEEKKVPAEDILCISYSVASKEDLRKKIEKTIGKTKIEVKTFHALGSKILKINEEKCRVKKDALERTIDLYFKNVVFQDKKLMQSIVTFFSTYFKNTDAQLTNYSSHQTIKSMIHAVDNTTNYEKMRVQDENKVTVDREYVRSVEELVIANFLYLHSINYVYEKEFTVKNEFFEENLDNFLNLLFINCEYIPQNIKLELYDEIGINMDELEFGFYPDFFLPDKYVYLEHFGVDRNCEAKWLKTDELKETYKKAMEQKIKIYNENNAKLITTYSYYNQENRLTERLEEKLRENGVEINDVDYESIFNELILNGKLKEYKLFKRVISTFINLFKGNGIYLDENGNDRSKYIFKKFKLDNEKKNKGNLQKRNGIFLNLIEEIYEYYHNMLKEHGKIDFNDMINDATIALKNGAKIHNYKYIIVDEYQDTSHMRYHLLKEIQKRTNAKITVVGDDWQSIYGFTGCDIHLFSNFNEYFKNPSIVKIQNTYRNSQALIDIAGKFIQNNPGQIKKELKSTNVTYKKPVKLAYYNDPIDEILMFLHILREINKKVINNPKKAEVLVLGRNNFDIEEIACDGLFSTEKLENETIINPELEEMNLKISFKTIHKSKGLEADYVILLNLNDKLAGFPNKIENDPILDYVTIKKEEILFAEERRLFYVALTRTLNDVFLLVPVRKQSQFILELELYEYILEKIEHDINDETLYNYIQENIKKSMIEIETEHTCPKCNIGKVKLLFNTKRGTKFFRCTEHCGWNGGWYSGDLKDVEHVKVCKKCHGMIILKTNLYGKKYPSCNFYAKRHKHSNRFKKYGY